MLRDYQLDIATKAHDILQKHGLVYLAMQVRTGKTLTSFATAQLFRSKFVLFITKKKAIGSIQKDYDALQPAFKIHITNYEQLGKFEIEGFDLVILDEAHCLGQFPSPAQRTKMLKEICRGLPIIYLSGTPTPESYSQIYHQLFVSSFTPFERYVNFYAWAKHFVKVRPKFVYNRTLNDYSHAMQDMIKPYVDPIMLTFTQTEAGFTEDVQEHVHKVNMKTYTYHTAKMLCNNKVVDVSKNVNSIYPVHVVADTEVQLMNKLHQLFSGTVIANENEQGFITDDYKAHYIKHHFKGQKIAIFYKFKMEYTLLFVTFGSQLTSDPEAFNNSDDLVFVSQIQSGREGINLSTADALIMFNIDFSALSYQQARARMQTKDRTKPCHLHWIFAEGGIEEKIHRRVMQKQDYTLAYFRRDFVINRPKEVKL